MTSVTPTIREVKALKGRPAGFSLLFDPTGTADEIIGWFMDDYELPEHLVHWHFCADRFAEKQPTDIADAPPFAYVNASVPDTSTMVISEITGTAWKNKKLMEATIKQLRDEPWGLLAQSKTTEAALVEDHIVAMSGKPEVRNYLGLGKEPSEDDKKPAAKKPAARSGKAKAAKAKVAKGKSVAPRSAAAKAKAKVGRAKKATPAKKPAAA